MNSTAVLILDPLKDVYFRFARLFPNILAMMVIFLVGIAVARILRAVLIKFLRAVDFNSWSDRTGFTSLLRRGNVWGRPADVVARFVFWVLIVMAVLAGLNALQIRHVDTMITEVLEYLPRALSALLILVLGYVGVSFLERTFLIAMVNSGFRFARPIARAARLLMILLLCAMALEQLDVAPLIVVSAFSIVFGGVVLALAISFGVAGIDVAKRMLRVEEEKKQESVASEMQHI